MRDQYYRYGQGFLLVYSITSRQSFEELGHIVRQVLSVHDADWFPMLLVGYGSGLQD
jgi:GTPase KRas protein